MDWTLFPSRALALNIQAIGEKLGEEFVYELGLYPVRTKWTTFTHKIRDGLVQEVGT